MGGVTVAVGRRYERHAVGGGALPAAGTPAGTCRPQSCLAHRRWRRTFSCSRRRRVRRRSVLRSRGCRTADVPPGEQRHHEIRVEGSNAGKCWGSPTDLQHQLRTDLVLPVLDPAGQRRLLGVAATVRHQLLLKAAQTQTGMTL